MVPRFPVRETSATIVSVEWQVQKPTLQSSQKCNKKNKYLVSLPVSPWKVFPIVNLTFMHVAAIDCSTLLLNHPHSKRVGSHSNTFWNSRPMPACTEKCFLFAVIVSPVHTGHKVIPSNSSLSYTMHGEQNPMTVLHIENYSKVQLEVVRGVWV